MEIWQSLSDLRANARLVRDLAQCAVDPYRPIMAHLVVVRRCNLACSYCHEYDKDSPPVPYCILTERIDQLQKLGTVFITLTGGETLLHPDIVKLVRYVRDSGMTPVMNSNGYLLHKTLIQQLNDAGLFAMQISIDNLRPNAQSKKSLKPLLPKLRTLSQYARFRVRINTVLGTGSPEEILTVAKTVTELGFDAKCSLVRDENGAFIPLSEEERDIYQQVRKLNRHTSKLSEDFQLKLLDDGEVDWKCRSGARYFTVCEDGLVHLCESSYGSPGKALEEYGYHDIRAAFHTKKSCSSTCSVAYAHQASRWDKWRRQTKRQEVTKRSWDNSANERTFLRVV